MKKYMFALQDDDGVGDAIYRAADSEQEALDEVHSQYPNVTFFAAALYELKPNND